MYIHSNINKRYGGKKMTDAKLITLITLAEKKSFTKTAEALSLTQPAVSHHIQQLENELNNFDKRRRNSGRFCQKDYWLI